jgi:hypothetical protein
MLRNNRCPLAMSGIRGFPRDPLVDFTRPGHAVAQKHHDLH